MKLKLLLVSALVLFLCRMYAGDTELFEPFITELDRDQWCA